jgi:signal peptidase I
VNVPALAITKRASAVAQSLGGRSHRDAAASTEAPIVAGRGRDRGRQWLEWVVITVAAMIVALVVRTSVLQAFYIPSESMVPTLNVNDRVLVNKLAYRFSTIDRGDVVVFERPNAAPGTHNPRDLVKRVIALGGDTVEAREGVVFVNGQPIDEPYVRVRGTTANLPLTTVPRDHLWVMGDNRTNSSDSRVFGPIAVTSVVGRAMVTVWPATRIGGL